MPVIKLTQKDISRMNPPDAGTFLAILREVGEKPSADKQSVNWTFEFEIQSPGPNNGRWATARANSKAPGMTLIPMISAMLDMPIDKVEAQDVDTDKLIGKPVGIVVKDDVYEGRIVKNIDSFVPPAKMTAPF